VRSTLDQREDGPWALVAGEDAGVGFGAAEASRLFEAFYTTKPGGLGMGLSISRSIIDSHRGRPLGRREPGPRRHVPPRLAGDAMSAENPYLELIAQPRELLPGPSPDAAEVSLMLHNQTYRSWGAVTQYLSGSIALALVTFVCFRLGLNLITTACLYLIVIVLLSLRGSFLLSAVFSLVGVACLAYYFAPPIFSFRVSEPLNAVAIMAFLTTSTVITHLVSRVHKSAETLREQAALLDLTHDTIFVRDLNDVITYWNRGAEELYGWTRNEAVGKVSHGLTQTVFPAPLDEIMAELTRMGRWEGELVHARRDGTTVVVASRWSLQRDTQGRPAGTLETNNDITVRKRAEEALQRTQTELAHVMRVTALGEIAASIAHEINQPLAAIVADANACLHWLATERAPVDRIREALAAILKDGDRAAEVITRIRALLSRSSIAHQPCDSGRGHPRGTSPCPARTGATRDYSGNVSFDGRAGGHG